MPASAPTITTTVGRSDSAVGAMRQLHAVTLGNGCWVRAMGAAAGRTGAEDGLILAPHLGADPAALGDRQACFPAVIRTCSRRWAWTCGRRGRRAAAESTAVAVQRRRLR